MKNTRIWYQYHGYPHSTDGYAHRTGREDRMNSAVINGVLTPEQCRQIESLCGIDHDFIPRVVGLPEQLDCPPAPEHWWEFMATEATDAKADVCLTAGELVELFVRAAIRSGDPSGYSAETALCNNGFLWVKDVGEDHYTLLPIRVTDRATPSGLSGLRVDAKYISAGALNGTV